MVVTVLFVAICVLDLFDVVIDVVEVRGVTALISAVPFDVSAIVVLTNAFVVIRASTYSDVATGDVVDRFIATIVVADTFEDDVVVDVIADVVLSKAFVVKVVCTLSDVEDDEAKVIDSYSSSCFVQGGFGGGVPGGSGGGYFLDVTTFLMVVVDDTLVFLVDASVVVDSDSSCNSIHKGLGGGIPGGCGGGYFLGVTTFLMVEVDDTLVVLVDAYEVVDSDSLFNSVHKGLGGGIPGGCGGGYFLSITTFLLVVVDDTLVVLTEAFVVVDSDSPCNSIHNGLGGGRFGKIGGGYFKESILLVIVSDSLNVVIEFVFG